MIRPVRIGSVFHDKRIVIVLGTTILPVVAACLLFVPTKPPHLKWDRHSCACATDRPHHVVISLPEKGSESLVVRYFTRGPECPAGVKYDVVSRHGDPSAYAFSASGIGSRVPGSNLDGYHAVVLDGLRPATTYYFVAGGDESGWSEEMCVRTLPDDSMPVKIVVGGDMDETASGLDLLLLAAKTNPDAAIIGGDIGQCKGRLENGGRWREWFHRWSALMRTEDGALIPYAAAVGDNEVELRGTGRLPKGSSPYFPLFCRLPGEKSFMKCSLGCRLTAFILDSGHLTEYGGEQLEWMESELEHESMDTTKIAIYHMPGWPARRHEGAASVRQIHAHWLPLFDKYGFSAAFEHHEHLLKRTKPIESGKPADRGVIYLGDGCFGKAPRSCGIATPELFAKVGSIAHFWLVECENGALHATAIDDKGAVVDEVSIENPPHI